MARRWTASKWNGADRGVTSGLALSARFEQRVLTEPQEKFVRVEQFHRWARQTATRREQRNLSPHWSAFVYDRRKSFRLTRRCRRFAPRRSNRQSYRHHYRTTCAEWRSAVALAQTHCKSMLSCLRRR